MCGIFTDPNICGNLSQSQTAIFQYQISHTPNNSSISSCLWPARPLITLHKFAAIFESVEPLFNLCYPHSIVTKHPLNFTNCFNLRITKLLTKFDAKFDQSVQSSCEKTKPDEHSLQHLTWRPVTSIWHKPNEVKKFKHVH
ncbi:hypothetical protein C0J52_22167 [Blattella germanica]|nr:hypothetical protein C0J52_22167 [Blattella germanica]PSN45496.1 hypothetical protein C0J52_22167 [Blattella germanica]PSN45497.1 hypothetical protein C0J52_22167 [Blattella germanica]PSN45498.1 hypothetical protein C0J52_22167 [Blattella germanica]